MRTILTAAVVSIFMATGGAATVFAESLEKAWETAAELKNPESAIYDARREVLYVSNVNGEAGAKDGNGFISKVGLDGTITELQWVAGLDAPKGLAISADRLYVADITALVEIDIENGAITNRYEGDGAKFFNDATADEAGNIYVSDTMTNTLHRLNDGKLTAWVSDEQLENPNGLLVEGDKLVVGAWGKMNADFSTDVAGHLKTVSLKDGAIDDLGDGKSVGNLDGVEPDGKGNYYVTDWMAGTLMHIKPSGEAKTVLELQQGSADHDIVVDKGLIVIPMMMQNTVVAYKIAE